VEFSILGSKTHVVLSFLAFSFDEFLLLSAAKDIEIELELLVFDGF
jgi:hypothetical protein